MGDRILVFPRGSAIQFTTGEYSDFSLGACLVTLRDCDLPKLAQEYAAAEWADPNNADAIKGGWFGGPDLDGFWGWLVAHGHALCADIQTIHLGAYRDFEPEFGVTKPETDGELAQ